MTKRAWTVWSAITVVGALALPVHLAAQNAVPGIITFDAPGADTAANDFDGTFPSSINDWGVITGSYIDANNVYHGFERSAEGRFITFEAPGADTTRGSFNGTVPNGINDLGEIVGTGTINGETHGYLLKLNCNDNKNTHCEACKK